MPEAALHTRTEEPLVSIALCTYNGEQYLCEQLDSLIGQSYPRLEIIAIDDNSYDNTVAILKTYAGRYPFIHIHENQENIGPVLNFEKALSYCSGEYIAISDQDDIWAPDKIRTLVDAIGDHLLVYAVSELVDESGATLHRTSIDKKRLYRGDDLRTALMISFTWGHNILFHRKLVQLALSPEGHTDYDWKLGLAALNYGRLTYVNRILVKHRMHQHNVTLTSDNRIGIKGRLQTLHARLQFVLGFKEVRHRVLIEKLYRLSNPNGNWHHRWKLAIVLFVHRKSLYFISAKSDLSTLNSIRLYLF